MVFSSSGTSGQNSAYNITVNDQYFRTLDWDWSSSVPYLQYAIEQMLSDVLAVTISGDGFGTKFSIRNLTDENLRIELSSWSSLSDFQVSPENNNPTVMNITGANHTFCLSAATD